MSQSDWFRRFLGPCVDSLRVWAVSIPSRRVDYAAARVVEEVRRLREISPAYKSKKNTKRHKRELGTLKEHERFPRHCCRRKNLWPLEFRSPSAPQRASKN